MDASDENHLVISPKGVSDEVAAPSLRGARTVKGSLTITIHESISRIGFELAVRFSPASIRPPGRQTRKSQIFPIHSKAFADNLPASREAVQKQKCCRKIGIPVEGVFRRNHPC